MASTNGNIFSETLQEITNTKLEELSKRRAEFESKRSTVLSRLDAAYKDPIKRLVILSEGVKHCLGVRTDTASGKVLRGHSKNPGLEIELKNLDSLLAQALYDPSVSVKSLKAWEASLLRHLDAQSLKYQYASLYAELVTEWLGSGKVQQEAEKDQEISGVDTVSDEAVASEEKKKKAARSEWERTVFEPAEVDETELRNFLAEIFRDDDDTNTKRNALKALRESVTEFENYLSAELHFTESTLNWVIRGLLASDLLSNEKRGVLKSFQDSSIILGEVADVLNMRLLALDSWSWGPNGVSVEQQRNVSGVHKIHMHEDLLQAIFLQYLGVKWSVFFKGALKKIRKFGGPWKNIRSDIPKIDKKRLGYYLGGYERSPSVQHTRRSRHRRDYFLANLLDSETQEIETLDGEEEVEAEESENGQERLMMYSMAAQAPAKRKARGLGTGGAMRHRRILPERDPEDTETDDEFGSRPTKKNPMDTKQKLLHILSTEIVINTRIHSEITALRTSFDSWDSLLPHRTVRLVLEFFGVSPHWLHFFIKFLEAPLKFTDEEEKSTPRSRRRGTPSSHVLSNVFGEVTLFCLDFHLNQITNGALLYRLLDDLWFWSPDHKATVQVWEAIRHFGAITGTTLNPSKTGAVRISGNPDVTLPIDQSLPKGQISWGFLRLSPETGRFEIDQIMVDKHIQELRKQLQGKRSSVFSFIQTWNIYATTFFTSNFGKPANCFGRDHVDLVLNTHSRIQREIFKSGSSLSIAGRPDGSASVADYLKNVLEQRFNVSDIPDAYLFFPVELGGLDLQSPFISILQIRDSVLEDPSTLLDRFEENERDHYNRSKIAFEKGERPSLAHSDLEGSDWEPVEKEDRETFMSFDEFTRWREEFSLGFDHELAQVYGELLEKPNQDTLELDEDRVGSAISALGRQTNLRGILADWHQMDPYWKWVVMQYGPEIIDRFGGLSIVDAGLLPMGMVSLFRDKRVKWQG